MKWGRERKVESVLSSERERGREGERERERERETEVEGRGGGAEGEAIFNSTTVSVMVQRGE